MGNFKKLSLSSSPLFVISLLTIPILTLASACLCLNVVLTLVSNQHTWLAPWPRQIFFQNSGTSTTQQRFSFGSITNKGKFGIKKKKYFYVFCYIRKFWKTIAKFVKECFFAILANTPYLILVFKYKVGKSNTYI